MIYHPKIIQYLPSPLLTNLHRNCCALRGKGWGRGNGPSTRWIWLYPYASLVQYHHLVLNEMVRRKFKPDQRWWGFGYRGRKFKPSPEALPQLQLEEPPYGAPMYAELDNPRKLELDLKRVAEWLTRKKSTSEDILRWSQACHLAGK